VYIYVSNEGTVQQEIYFDDLTLTHTKGAIVQMDDYYPFGLTFNSYSRENSVTNNKKFQSQEHIDDLSLNWDSFKWRNYQPEIGRFFNIDPLAEKYVHNSTYAFAENKVITFRELEGLEGVHYMEGNKHVVEKNVVVLLENHKTAKQGASEKQIKRVENQNKRIDARNVAKLESVRTELNSFYNGSDGKGATNSKGETVKFKFNVTGAPDISDNDKKKVLIDRNAMYKAIGNANGIAACREDPQGGYNTNAPGAVLTNETVSNPGETTAAIVMRLNLSPPSGAVAHEALHSLGVPDDGYTHGGILNSPPEGIKTSEVDQVLNAAYEKQF
jgi:RHS repeat-associated protein